MSCQRCMPKSPKPDTIGSNGAPRFVGGQTVSRCDSLPPRMTEKRHGFCPFYWEQAFKFGLTIFDSSSLVSTVRCGIWDQWMYPAVNPVYIFFYIVSRHE